MNTLPAEATPPTTAPLTPAAGEDETCPPEFTEAYAERSERRWLLRCLRKSHKEERRKLTALQPHRAKVLEPAALAGRPLAPLGRLPTDGGPCVRVVAYPGLDWRLVLPGTDKQLDAVPADVVELYLWLVNQWRRMPDEERRKAGYVDFTMGTALSELGWRPRDPEGAGKAGAAGRPSGRAYRKLQDGLRYLMELRIASDEVTTHPSEGTGAARDEFVILQRVQLGNRGARAGRVSRHAPQAPSSVQFSSGMVELLSAETVELDADVLLTLPSGLPRALYRVLCWARHSRRNAARGTLELGVSELFQRLGYLRARATQARAREMLGPAHAVLESHGVLAQPPEHATAKDGALVVRYAMVDLSDALTRPELLVAVAVSYGVVANIARDLARRFPAQLERVLAAVTIGLVVPRKGIGSAVNHYTANELPIVDNERRWLDASPCSQEPDGAAYLRWAAARRADLVRKRRATWRWRPHDLPEGLTLVEDAMRNRQTRDAIESDWLTEGLAQLRLHHDLRIPSFEQWRRRGRPSG
ncbi:MAG: hypothetical protein LOY01_04710 [Brachybacterium paraconglomeratum]|nr:hypothetical protein [Brachybacterium paraconglomeratum]